MTSGRCCPAGATPTGQLCPKPWQTVADSTNTMRESHTPVKDAQTTAGFGPPHGTLTDFAADQLRQRIVLGTLSPGTRLRVEELSAELGISRVPLREAFRELLSEGLLEMYPRRGAVVSEIRRQDVDDSYRMLELMEVMATERAAATYPEETATAMEAALERMRRTEDADDPAAMLFAHREFHAAVFARLGPGALQRHVRVLWYSCERYINASLRGERARQAHREHEELVRCFSTGDAIGATAVARMHVQHGRLAALQGLGTTDRTTPAEE